MPYDASTGVRVRSAREKRQTARILREGGRLFIPPRGTGKFKDFHIASPATARSAYPPIHRPEPVRQRGLAGRPGRLAALIGVK